MNFEDLSYNELLNVSGGKEANVLKIVGKGVLTAGSVMSGGPVPAVFKITRGILSIMDEF